MPRFGDELSRILRSMSENGALTPGDFDTLRLEGNRVGDAAARVAVIGGVTTGGLAANVFTNSAGFSVLPHETAGLTKTAGQDIANTGWTTLTWDETSNIDWNHGMSFSPATSPTTISVSGRAGDSVYLVTVYVQWNSSTVGHRALRVNGIDAYGNVVLQQLFHATPPSVGLLLNHGGALPVSAVADGGGFYIEAGQDTAGVLAISSGRFSVTRLR